MMNDSIKFEALEKHSERFFDILPDDWKSAIVPFWNTYKQDTKIYVITNNTVIIGGGLVFSTCPPDLLNYSQNAQKWFDKGYLYIGFLWISENYRNRHLGTYWLDALKTTLSNSKLWLIIEDEKLDKFYRRNGFTLDTQLDVNGFSEWLYTYTPNIN